MQLLTALAPFVPLLQTALWIAFALGLAIWFRKHVRAILQAVQRRIESGATVKAGWFELSEQIKPQSPDVQRKRLDDETKEVIGNQSRALSAEVSDSTEDVRALLLQSEDLALRAIQAEFSVPVNRQVTVGAGAPFDAAFFRDGSLILVEVKTFFRGVDRIALQNAIAKLIGYSDALPKLHKRFILAIVFRAAAEIAANEEEIILALSHFGSNVEVRLYALPELQQKFGAVE